MSVLHDVRQDLRDFLFRDEKGELSTDQRRALIDATIRDLQDFEVQLTNAMAVLMNAPVPAAHKGKEEEGYVVGGYGGSQFPSGSAGGSTRSPDVAVSAGQVEYSMAARGEMPFGNGK